MTDTSNNQAYGQPDPETSPLKADIYTAREKIGEAAQAVRQEAAHFAETARDKATDQVERGKEAVTSAVGDFAEAIRKASQELCERDQTMAARLVSQAADGLESFSRAATEKRPEEMLNAVRDFGRANPTAFLAGAVLAGLALGRFAKSSAPEPEEVGGYSQNSPAPAADPGRQDAYGGPSFAQPLDADIGAESLPAENLRSWDDARETGGQSPRTGE